MLKIKQRPRIYYTETDKSMMWDRWQKGESLSSIARLFDRHHSAIQGILSRTGGIRPPQRRRSGLAGLLACPYGGKSRIVIKRLQIGLRGRNEKPVFCRLANQRQAPLAVARQISAKTLFIVCAKVYTPPDDPSLATAAHIVPYCRHKLADPGLFTRRPGG